MDGNMLSDGCTAFEYDSANRLIKADGHTYTYNAEDVRIRNLCSDADTTYTYNTNCKLSQLLTKTTNGITTKYVYGHGLIGEEKEGCFKTYHFDFRGSTVAITDICGNITDTFKYDTYGKIISRTGDSFVIFEYNGRDGVITDKNGLIYMRARYYSPEMRRFVNADILHGEISDSTSLNRYSYVNGNPVSFVDPFGLSADDRGITSNSNKEDLKGDFFSDNFSFVLIEESEYEVISLDNFFFGYESGATLGKSIKGPYKPIQLFGELSLDEGLLNIGGGFKANFNEKSGFKFGFNNNEITFEAASEDVYFELVLGNMKAGFTVSKDVDWKNNEVGAYNHYYVRPANIAGAIVVLYFTAGAAAPVFYELLERCVQTVAA